MSLDFDVYVEYGFLERFESYELAHLVELASKTCWVADSEPTAILIRSDVHNTKSKTVKSGPPIRVPDRWHITISVKDTAQSKPNYHTTYHGYLDWKESKDVTDVKKSGRKPDFTLKGTGSKRTVCWPTDLNTLYRLSGAEIPDLEEIYEEFCRNRQN